MNVAMITPVSLRRHQNVVKIIAVGNHGRFCILPKHTDYLAALTPGILTLVDQAGPQQLFATDYGLLVKRGDEVSVSTRQAIPGDDLSQLRLAVSQQIQKSSQTEQAGIAAVASLEANLVRRLLTLPREIGE